MAQKKTIATQIAALTESVQAQALDEQTRLEALNNARDLLATLESPIERIVQDVVMVSALWFRGLKFLTSLFACTCCFCDKLAKNKSNF